MAYPDTPPRRKNNSSAGCWLTGLITLVIAAGLVLVGLFLPPFDLYNRLFGEPFVTLSLAGDSIATQDGGFRLVAAADIPTGGFEARVDTVSQTSFEVATAEDWMPFARSALPAELAFQSAIYTVETTRSAPVPMILSVTLPHNNLSVDILDLYGWYASEQGGQWRFLPTAVKNGTFEAVTGELPRALAIFQTAPRQPAVVIAYDVNQVLSQEVGSVGTIVSPAGLQPTLTGAITGSLAPGFTSPAPYAVMPVIRDFADPRAVDTATVIAILSNSTLRRTHVEEITVFTTGQGFAGVFIDYRGLPVEQRDNFSAFIRELNKSLKQYGLALGVVVPAAENTGGVWETGAYDWRAIGAHSDYVQINLPINPRLYTPGDTQLIEAMLRWAKGEISRYKILLGLSAQSAREIAGVTTPIGYDEGLAGLGDVKIEADKISASGIVEPGATIHASLDGLQAIAGVDTLINTPYLDYLNADMTTAARVWLTTGDALRYRMDLTIPFSLGGVAFDDLLEDDLADNLLAAIANYQIGLPAAPAPVDLALRWTIAGSDGSLIGEVTTGINEPLVATIAAPDGNYAINVVVQGIGQDVESPRTGVQVAQFQPTPTATPLPTATPTPIPTATYTPAPIVSTAPASGSGNTSGGQGAAPSGGGFGAQRPGAGSIAVGGFEYGGHVTGVDSQRAVSAMRRAGMTWIKVQHRFYPGSTGDSVAAEVGLAHSMGFKILIGTVGSPNDLQAGGDAYMREYARWLGQVAAAGADAVEVWNEPNIDREWPEGQISGQAYAQMLRYSYEAVKSANANTFVISAAPAPTGAEAAYPGKVMNDNRWLQEVVNAGGLQFMDCVGAHYNEGIVPPGQTSGDPRDNYYTRYFAGMLNTYAGIVGGAKPLCFTELGYLTPEGYGALDPYFGWASNVTLAQQAAWLAQAAALSSQSGKVRLMIVWNVDFTHYGSDPQAGYAMVRPDGSCPACDALAAAR